MHEKDFIERCKALIVGYYKNKLNININQKHVYTVWQCKILQNNKALLSTQIPDTRYFEITYNGDKDEFYFDGYTKEINFKY